MENVCMYDNYPFNLNFFLNNFIGAYLSTTFYILYLPHFIFDLDYIILHWSENNNII
jgi:hypothetical protein